MRHPRSNAPPTIARAASRRRERWGALAIVLFTLLAYQPAWTGGRLWDDDAHLTAPALQSLDGLRRIWLEIGATQQYYPVVHSAFWLQHRLWGDATLGYHLVTIGLHALSACLLWILLRRLDVPPDAAWLSAAVFALHPVQVESVAWMTELKNTLSGALYLSAALAYLAFHTGRRSTAYATALALFVAALLAKSVTATLPAVLLVMFWWKRGRIRPAEDVAPLVPFFAAGIAAGLMTAWFERAIVGAEGADFQLTWIERGLVAGRAFWFYLGTLAWPSRLAFIYPRWNVSQSIWWQYLYPAGAVALVVGLWTMRRRSRAPLAAVLCFAGTLFPALGFFDVYPFQFSFVADHFQYLAAIPIVTALSALVTAATARWPRLHGPAAVALVGALAVLTWHQSHLYADAETLYRGTLARNPTCWMAHDNLGQLTLDRARSAAEVEAAIGHFRASLALRPDRAPAHHNLGLALQRLGRPDDALAELTAAVRLEPRLAEAHAARAALLADLDRFDDALAESREAVRLKPSLAEAQSTMGSILQRMGRVLEAVPPIQEAVRLAPASADFHVNLGTAYGRLERFDDSIAEYERALALDAGSWRAHANLGYVLLRVGRLDESVAHLQEAVRLEPEAALARANLEAALAARRARR